jgi:hypothetical protein
MNVWKELFGSQGVSEMDTIEGVAQNVEQTVEHAAETAVADVKAAFVDTEKAVLTVLGHAHNLLSGFSLTAEVQTARTAVETAIINFAKHLGQ